MKKNTIILGIFLLLISSQCYSSEIPENKIFAENNTPKYTCTKDSKCLDLMKSMYNERATLYNVLNLSNDQLKCKDSIDKNRYSELKKIINQYEQEKFVLTKMQANNASKIAVKKQEKVVKNIEKNFRKTGKKYDKEFKTILNSEQKAKYNSVKKMERKEIKYCMKNKAFYKRDPKLRPFGEKMYYGEQNNLLCPVHKKWHLFGRKHKLNK